MFEIMLHRESDKIVKVPGNILKYSLQNKSLQSPFVIVYDLR